MRTSLCESLASLRGVEDRRDALRHILSEMEESELERVRDEINRTPEDLALRYGTEWGISRCP